MQRGFSSHPEPTLWKCHFYRLLAPPYLDERGFFVPTQPALMSKLLNLGGYTRPPHLV